MASAAPAASRIRAARSQRSRPVVPARNGVGGTYRLDVPV
jgi:hypothetical protein